MKKQRFAVKHVICGKTEICYKAIERRCGREAICDCGDDAIAISHRGNSLVKRNRGMGTLRFAIAKSHQRISIGKQTEGVPILAIAICDIASGEGEMVRYRIGGVKNASEEGKMHRRRVKCIGGGFLLSFK